jgi:hypothetical protein
MSEWLDHHLLDLIHLVIGMTIVEVIALCVYFHYTKRGVAPSQFLLNIVSGLCLMGAVRSVLMSAPAMVTAAWLLASGLVHVCDMLRRWNK